MARVIIFTVFTLAVLAQWTSNAFVLTPTDALGNSIPTDKPAIHMTNSAASLNLCKHCVCGVSRRPRIVNGDITSFDEYPWAVQIKKFDEQHCGGSLITAKHILTAAHCFFGFDEKTISVHLADNATHRIKSVVMHSKYKYINNDNDIAIIELVKPVTLGGAVRTVCLPTNSEFKYTGKTGVAIGWGRLGEYEPVSEELRRINLPIMSKQHCLQSNYLPTRVTDNMFCAGYLEGGRDSCKGDSGGPLQVRNDAGAMEVVGIVSFGKGCAELQYPGVYTKVTNYLEWISEQLKDECLCSPPS